MYGAYYRVYCVSTRIRLLSCRIKALIYHVARDRRGGIIGSITREGVNVIIGFCAAEAMLMIIATLVDGMVCCFYVLALVG